MENEANPFSWPNSRSNEGISSETAWQNAQPIAPLEDPAKVAPSATQEVIEASLIAVSVGLSADIYKNGENVDSVYCYSDGRRGNGVTSAFELTDPPYDPNLTRAEATAVEALLNEKLALFFDHFERRGFIRCDHVGGIIHPKCDPGVYLVGLCREAERPGRENWGVDFEYELDAAGMVRDLSISSGQPLLPAAKATPEMVFELLKTMPQADPRLRPCRAIGSEKLPEQSESFAAWIDRVALSPATLRRQAAMVEAVGHDIEAYALVTGGERAPVEWIVPGLIPRGTVELLVGSNQTGKSTMMDELCAKLECPIAGAEPQFLGVPVPTRLMTVYLSGEDPREIFSERRFVLSRNWGEGSGLVIDATTKTLDELLPLLTRLRPDLIVIDPARRFIEGDEDSSANINAFFQELEKLNQALDKKSAIIGIHHCKKGQQPRRLADIMPRGSGVMMDRPRIVLGMFRLADGTTGVGILKHNFPPSVPMWERGQARYFRFNKETLCLDPVGKVSGPNPKSQVDRPDNGLKAAVLAAIRRLNELDQVVQQTGKRELFHLEIPELTGFARSKIRETVAALITEGQIEQGARGLVARIS